MKDIKGFQGEYRFLSNFTPALIEYEGLKFPTVEHAYQAAKSKDVHFRRHVAELLTPGRAKRAGQTAKLRTDWEDVKLGIMLDLLRIKFKSSRLRLQLKQTGSAHLEETNYWGDTFWGVCKGKGENQLGKLLMKVRDEIHYQDCN